LKAQPIPFALSSEERTVVEVWHYSSCKVLVNFRKTQRFSGLIMSVLVMFFCISLKEPTEGALFHWDHEQANYDGEPWEYNMTKLSPSLTVFLEELCVGE
jgi:hypothetical protein